MIILTGKPGSGKDTQADFLVSRNGLIVLRAGDLLRDAALTDADISEAVQEGRSVDDDVLFGLLGGQLTAQPSEKIVLDNFPRNPAQAEWLIEQLRQPQHAATKVVIINLDVTDEVAASRATTRHRTDDTPEAFLKRLEIYSHEVLAAQAVLVAHNARLLEVDGSGSPEEVYAGLTQALKGVGML